MTSGGSPSGGARDPGRTADPLVLPFSALALSDVPRVGGKNASLGEMVRALAGEGVSVPPGFATTADAFRAFLAQPADDPLRARIARALVGLDTRDTDALARAGLVVRDLILASPLPVDLESAVRAAYRLLGEGRADIAVAVRSSATAEDLPDASFAGQQETFLNIRGEAALLDAVRKCIASLYTDRAISYRVDKGFAHDAVALSVGVQRMVRSDLACSGVMFSIDTETGFADAVLISGAWGLGETVVQGAVNPDEYLVYKPGLARKEGTAILQKTLGAKELKMVYAGGTRGTKTIPVATADRDRFTLNDAEVVTLARWACAIERHYAGLRGTAACPMDMEWAKDGETGELYIVQARPETVQARKRIDVLERWVLDGKGGEVLVTGRAVGDRIGSGPVRLITDVHHLASFEDGDVLVADRTDPDWEPIMKKAAAIVTNRGGRTCHAAIVSRELGIPAVVGVGDGTTRLKAGRQVTVACDQGDEGRVFKGALPFHVDRTPLREGDHELARPRTKIMMNVGNPAEAFRLSQLPNDGVGLARLEFIISSWIGVHPRALIDYPTLAPDLRRRIAEAARGYEPGPDWFVDRLAQGVGTLAAAFAPRPVIARLSDFKTNEYAHLLGGEAYEPKEENPMLGFRGASRYYDPRYRDAFALECRAMKRVRDEMDLTNLILMVPFCRTPEEGRLVIAEMAKHGLVQGQNGLQIYVMCEIPSNIELADEFADVFDGFSIGSNDLTQLILGLDRDSELVARLFDERSPAVTRAIARVIKAAHARGRKIGICGQAPSDHPDFLRFLVGEGIDSISLNPDTVLRGTIEALAAEAALR